MRFKFVLILGIFAALAIIAAGCGGGSDSSSSTTASKESTPSGEATPAKEDVTSTKGEGSGNGKRMTSSEFRIRMNEACIQVPPTYKEELKKLKEEVKAPTKAEINLKAAVPPLYSTISLMESLKPPANEEQKKEEVIDALESAAKGLEAEPESELSGPNSPFAEFQKLTKEYGFETCSGL